MKTYKMCMYVYVQIWQRVKAQNPDLSVCAIGAAIGRMWRELPAIEKEKYNEEFSADKVHTSFL